MRPTDPTRVLNEAELRTQIRRQLARDNQLGAGEDSELRTWVRRQNGRDDLDREECEALFQACEELGLGVCDLGDCIRGEGTPHVERDGRDEDWEERDEDEGEVLERSVRCKCWAAYGYWWAFWLHVRRARKRVREVFRV